MPIRRKTIIFELPLDITTETKSSKLSDNVIISPDDNKLYVQMYINPESFNVSDKKLINTQMTKGGYAVQYWGEELSSISISGTTGSSGIEGINILRSVYRHEQKQFQQILNQRLQTLTEEANQAALNIAKDLQPDYSNTIGGFLAGAADLFTGGLYSNLVNGFQTLTDVITGDFSLPDRKEYANFSTTASLAYLATGVVIHYGGERYRGFFENFNLTEGVNQLGLFSYSMQFRILKRSGTRNNFMPWHRSPVDSFGNPIKASVPMEGQRTDELSVPYGQTEIESPSRVPGISPFNSDDVNKVFSSFTPNQENTGDQNTLPLRNAIRRR